MIPPDYLILRLARRFLPIGFTQTALRAQILIRPGLETRDPGAAADLYLDALQTRGRELSGATVFVLGYGGYFGMAVQLLNRGARHVTLCDPYARLNARANARLAIQAPEYLMHSDDQIRPNPSRITVLPVDVRQIAAQRLCRDLDLVLSWSVYEHLVHPGEVTAALAQITSPNGCNLHFIDLRDHFFRHPFEMLCYRDQVWDSWLNPSSNLNRWRTGQYQEIFQQSFDQVQVEVPERDLTSFLRARERIRPEFLTGDDEIDCATRLMVYGAEPRAPR